MPLWAVGAVLGGIAGGIFGRGKAPNYGPLAEAQKYAADKQFEASELNRKAWEAENARQRKDYAPYIKAGLGMLADITEGVKSGRWTVDDIEGKLGELALPSWGGYETQLPEFSAPTGEQALKDDPSYQFRLKQGEKTIRRNAAALGMARSGATAIALAEYGQDYASTEYGKAYDRALQNYQVNRQNALVERDAERERYDLDVNRRMAEWEANRSNVLTQQDLLNSQYDRLVNSAATLGLGAVNRQNQLSYSILGRQADSRTLGASALGAGAIGQQSALLQGRIEAERTRRQNIANIFHGAKMGLQLGGSLG